MVSFFSLVPFVVSARYHIHQVLSLPQHIHPIVESVELYIFPFLHFLVGAAIDIDLLRYHIYEFWNCLIWSQTLAWSNIIDPRVRSSLHAAAAYVQLMNVTGRQCPGPAMVGMVGNQQHYYIV